MTEKGLVGEDGMKKRLLWIFGKFQQAAERNAGLIFGLFLLNYFTIFWANYHAYQFDQLAVVLLDGVFLLVGTGVYVTLWAMVPSPFLRREGLFFSFFLSALLGGMEIFSIYHYEALIGAGIVTAVFQTNSREAWEFLEMYVGWKGGMAILAGGVVFHCVYRYLSGLRFTVVRRHWQNRLLPLLLLAGLLSACSLWNCYHSFILNDSLDIPAVQVCRAIHRALLDIVAYERLDREMADSVELTENGSSLPHVAMILGESTYRGRMHLYGYDLENTPELEDRNRKGELAVFRDVISPQGATVAVLRELFTFHDAESHEEWYHCNNLIDVLRTAGYKTYWLSNQESSGIWGNVAQLYANRCTKKAYTSIRESHEDHGRLDEELLPLVDMALAEAAEKNFYVIHLMGGHSLYYKRFPYRFTKFTAEDIHGEQSELPLEKRTELAQYANALYYNDSVVSGIMDRFREEDALVIYLSDHGETIYDDGSDFAGHVEESPNKYTLEIPLLFWASEKFRARHPEKWAALQSAVNRPYMTDDMIHTILDLMDIRTPEYDPGRSLVHPSFDAGRRRIVRDRDYDASIR